MREPVTKSLSFYSYAWETDIEYAGHSNDDFCDMLVLDGENTKCPLPKGEVRLQFRLPAMPWEHKVGVVGFVRFSRSDVGGGVRCLLR
jgi:hypothetical protein